MNREKRLPPIGLRIVKSAAAVFLCYLVDLLRHGIPFYSALAALQCMQPYVSSTRKMAVQRLQGTFLGAAYGLVVILIQQKAFERYGAPAVCRYLLVAATVVCVLYTTVLIHRKNVSYFSCVVFLSITMIHLGDENPYIFVLNRVADTLIGVGIGMTLNRMHLPRRRRSDVLFVSGLDDVLLSVEHPLSDYSRIVLNRMLDDGIPFTIMTMRTPASFLEAVKDIHWNIPVILMDGAALYDVENNHYIHKFEIPYADAVEIDRFFTGQGHNCFKNVILEDTVVILYRELRNAGEQAVYDRLRRSPYRNYMRRELAEGDNVAYFMVMDEKSRITDLYHALLEQPFCARCRVLCYDSTEFPGFAYIKVYDRNATKRNMLRVLQRETGMEKVVTIGSVPGLYDVEVSGEHSGDEVVHLLRELCEPPAWRAEA